MKIVPIVTLVMFIVVGCRVNHSVNDARATSNPRSETSTSATAVEEEKSPIDPTLRAMQKARDIKAGEDKKAAETNEALDP